MKLPFVALLLAASCSFARAASDAVALEVPGTSGRSVFEAGLVQVTPLAPLRSQSSVIVSAESALRHVVTPCFPREMRRARRPGFVRLEVVVADDGHVIAASVLESSHDPFAREALRAVGQWQFLPAETPPASGRRVVRVPIEFRIFRRVR